MSSKILITAQYWCNKRQRWAWMQFNSIEDMEEHEVQTGEDFYSYSIKNLE